LTDALPIGAELAVSQQLEDLLSSDEGRALLIEIADRDMFSAPAESAKARRELAAYLARKLVSSGA